MLSYKRAACILALPLIFAVLPKAAQAGEVYRFNVYYSYATQDMMDVAEEVVFEAAKYLQSRPNARIVVVGHTDTAGKDAANLVISRKRAQEVANLLISKGIARNRIEVFGRGERELAYKTADGVKEPLNRRVEIRVFEP